MMGGTIKQKETAMRSKDVLYVVLKLFIIVIIAEGIYYLGLGIGYWSAYLNQKASSIDAKSTWVMITQASFLFKLISAAFLFGMAHFIWIFAPKIVKYIFPSDSKIQAKNLQTAAFILVGIVVSSRAILTLFRWIGGLIWKIQRTQVNKDMAVDKIPIHLFDAVFFLTIIGMLIYLIIGIALIVWGKQFSKFISKTKTGAVSLVQRLRLPRKTEKPGKTGVKEIQTG